MTDLLDLLKAALSDRYRIELEVDGSRTAVEYFAHDQKLDQEVSLNVLRPDFAASLETARFLQQMREAAQLSHPDIQAPYDIGDANGLIYYVMPLVDGESLRQRLARKTRLSVDEAVEVVRHLAAALEHAHGMGVVHRGLKPETVLLPEGQAVLAEFGVARAVRAAAGERFSDTRLSPGRPYYMSPEQVLGDTVDERTDLYSLGAMLFEMVTGEKPFEGETIQEVVAQHIANPVRQPREVQPAVPDWMSDLIVQCMEKAPKDRFQSAHEILEALDAEAATTQSGGAGAAPDDDLGVGTIVQGAGWDFDDDIKPQVKPPPQPVYDVGPAESPPEPRHAEQPDAPPIEPEPPPAAPISSGGDIMSGTWMDMDQMAPAGKPPSAPEPVAGEEVRWVEESEPPTEADAAAEEPGHIEPEGLAPIRMKPAGKWDPVRRVLARSYDYGPELAVRLARKRVTWYYVGGGAAVILVWLILKALFFGPPTLHRQYISNTLVEPIEVQVDGRVVQTLQPGQQDSMVLPRDRPIEVSWRLMRPSQAGGSQMGEEFWEVLTTGRREGGDVHSVIAAVTPDRAMFAPAITNVTRNELVALINAGTPAELRCNCVIPPGARDVHIGYYPLLENSTVRFFDSRRPYAGRYQEIGDFAGRVDSLSGLVGLRVER